MRILLLVTTFLLVTGCASSDSEKYYNKPYPKAQLICGKDQIEWCEGRTPSSMECTCVKRRELERAFRNSNLIWN